MNKGRISGTSHRDCLELVLTLVHRLRTGNKAIARLTTVLHKTNRIFHAEFCGTMWRPVDGAAASCRVDRAPADSRTSSIVGAPSYSYWRCRCTA